MRVSLETAQLFHKLPSFKSTILILSILAFCHAPIVLSKELIDLSLEELSNIKVTSVSKRSELLSDAPASIFVISNEEIRRSGATSLPEALKLAPNLQVARESARNYAIAARGFNNVFSNKLLVLLDGRTIYSPLFSGVFWDVQDVMLEDVDRIEVISGTGATLWGSNAMNGVINIITKSSKQTQGGLVSAGGSFQERQAAVRYGGQLANNGTFRLFGKYSDHDDTELTNGRSFEDGWRRNKAGFRADWQDGYGSFTLQGDAYEGRLHQFNTRDIYVSGANLLTRTNSNLKNGSEISLQAYVDYTSRDQPGAFTENLTTADIELKHTWKFADRHLLVWGGEYRIGFDRLQNDNAFAFLPASKNLQWANVFAQDEIELAQNLKLTLGMRLEHNNYTGLENLPSARIAWKPSSKHLFWASMSRSVRAPSRIDRDFFAPTNPPVVAGVPLYLINGGRGFESEIAETHELGYKASLSPAASISLTAFYTEYDKLRTLQPDPSGIGFSFENNASGRTHGIEMWGTWQPLSSLRLSGGGVIQMITQRANPGVLDILQSTGLGSNDPSNHWLLRASYDLNPYHELDATIRHVGKLTQPDVPAFTTLDIRYGWKIRRDLELSVVGQNLLDDKHPEFDNVLNRPQFERALFAKVVWRFN